MKIFNPHTWGRTRKKTPQEELRDLLMSAATTKNIHSLNTDLSGWMNHPQSPEYTTEVEVRKIVGSATRPTEYLSDWTPVRKDDKWRMLEDAVAEGKRLDELAPSRPIELLHVNGRYYVSDDGHRRVAIAKREKYERLKCTVKDILTGQQN